MVKIDKEKVILGSVIAVIIITAGALSAILLTRTEVKLGYSLIERLEYTYDADITTIDIQIFNEEGSIFISYEEELESVFEAENRFYGKREAVIDDATNFTYNEVGDTLEIEYYAPKLYEISDDHSFYNNLHIKIRADIEVFYNITTATGDIYLVFDSVLTPTVVKQLNIYSSTGDITVTFGHNTATDCSFINMESVTGKLNINFDMVEILSRIDMWNISSKEGIIDFHFDQSEISGIHNASFNIETDTGRVDLRYKFHDETGIQVNAITSIGTITSDLEIPGPFTPYQNEIFPTVENFKFSFTAGTGSIRIKELVF